jgi:DNA-binding FadR family transcriptional regulator
MPSRGRNLTFGLLEAIGRAVIDGNYVGGRFPTEGDLAREHGVSRSVTREATKMLAAKGLLSARPRQGTFIQPDRNWNLLDPDVLRWMREGRHAPGLARSLTELRASIEPHAASLAANRGEPGQIHAIAKALDDMRGSGLEGDAGLAAQCNFHLSVLMASGNPFFLRLDEMVETGVCIIRRVFTDRAGLVLDHYGEIHAAIARGEGDGAHTVMRAYFARLLERLGRA